jgi:copper chaperone CopZ
MSEPRKEHLMHVEALTSEACAEAVRQAVRRLDASAEVSVDLEHRRITVATFAQALDVAQALDSAGYPPTGMTL